MPDPQDRPTLICFDGSAGSRQAMASTAQLLRPHSVVVLTVWEALETQIARAGGFAGLVGMPAEADEAEQAAAAKAAGDGVAAAKEQGFEATARVEQADMAVWRTIVQVADEIDAALIVCGTRGRGGLESVMLGSTSHAVLRHSGRPVLIAPEGHAASGR